MSLQDDMARTILPVILASPHSPDELRETAKEADYYEESYPGYTRAGSVSWIEYMRALEKHAARLPASIAGAEDRD